MDLLSPRDVVQKGLRYMGLGNKPYGERAKFLFRKHYGASALTVAEMWYEMIHTILDGDHVPIVSNEETGESSFKMYLMAHHFLWIYPKNAELLASRFGVCEKYARGENLWKWVKKMAALKAKKIVWPRYLDSPHTEIFTLTVDGVDFRVWETKHPTMPIDRQMCSHKFKHAAVKYEVAMSVYESRVVWINGPFKGGVSDLDIFRAGLKNLVAPNKLVIADKGYRSRIPQEKAMLSTPSSTDPRELAKFKSRARLRQETFNGRLKFYAVMCETFRHGCSKHKIAFEAVATIIQYGYDNGSEPYET